jgi:hypothetical protein
MRKSKLIKSTLTLSTIGAMATGIGVTTASCTTGNPSTNKLLLKSTLVSNDLKVGYDNTAVIKLEEVGENITWVDPTVTGVDDFNWVGD